MPRLNQRLALVAQQIRAATHVDVGSDHGYLLKALLDAGQIQRGIAIENKKQPFLNSQATLAGSIADVRLGDGLETIGPGEADSLSICGMGGKSIRRILQQFPDRVPPSVVVQPNTDVDRVRLWGQRQGFWLKDEFVADDRGHEVLVFARADSRDAQQNDPRCDPAYDGLDHRAALLFGPWHIRRGSETFKARLQTEHSYLAQFGQLSEASQERFDLIAQLLATD